MAAEHPELRGRRLGLVTNAGATTGLQGDRPLTPARVALLEAGYGLVRLFAPEHGLASAAADGVAVGDGVDPLTGLPVVSLYGSRLAPDPHHLADLEGLLFDVPDIGARFYTYVWTLSHVMEACAQEGTPLWVLDRPNPLGGDLAAAEGPLLDEAQVSSFVGRWSIPVRHSLTVGELARLWQRERLPDLELTVVPVEGWRREQHWPETGMPFVPPSPAMPSYETALLYPGTCLLEGTNVSEGRGTAMPFRQCGAPWVDGPALAARFNELGLPGVVARAVRFTPSLGKHAGSVCHGVMLHVVDPVGFRPVRTGLHLVALLRHLHPDHFAWIPYTTPEAGPGHGHFDRLVGRLDVRPTLEAQPPELQDHIRRWTAVPDWSTRVEEVLLYGSRGPRSG